GDQVAHINLGVGLNVNNRPEKDNSMAVSLRSLLGRPVPRREILAAFLDAFERRMLAFDPQDVVQSWKSYNVTLGKAVRVATVNETVEGSAQDLDDTGGLVLRMSDGTDRTVVYGDCFHS
ncbi:MAG TPA: biotin--[acetyl-CoA-carboxylase] ligase, partial [Desulfosarcina sp.]|nr:biotin--[acetyl-CoA-carboxylase] ligase [Desulfosarcina sp.]